MIMLVIVCLHILFYRLCHLSEFLKIKEMLKYNQGMVIKFSEFIPSI